jgi:predicted nucleic acid-binding protein
VVRVALTKYLEAVVAALPTVAYTEETAYFHACLWSNLGASGKVIGAYDLIAAMALQRGSAVATFDRRLSQVDGLNIIEPKWT